MAKNNQTADKSAPEETKTSETAETAELNLEVIKTDISDLKASTIEEIGKVLEGIAEVKEMLSALVDSKTSPSISEKVIKGAFEFDEILIGKNYNEKTFASYQGCKEIGKEKVHSINLFVISEREATEEDVTKEIAEDIGDILIETAFQLKAEVSDEDIKEFKKATKKQIEDLDIDFIHTKSAKNY